LRFGSNLSKDLREKYGKRTTRPRVGYSVRVVRGEFKNIEGKVTKVLPKKGRLTVEGITREKQKGGNAPVAIHASSVMITSLNLDDDARKKKLEAEK